MDKAKAGHDGLYERLRQELGNIQLVDAHEHLLSEEQWLTQEIDLITPWTSPLVYARTDLVCAGMPKDGLLPIISADDEWAQMRPFWRYVRNMGACAL